MRPIQHAIYCMPVPIENAPAERSLLRDDVFTRLRDAIVDGTFAPGEQLRDQELAEWLGVSRTPVREALLRIGEAGLVVARPGRSTLVSDVDVDAVRDARDVVAALHGLAVREAVGHLTKADLRRMREANRRFRSALRASDVEAAITADDDLHAVPVDVSGNRALRAVLEQYTPVLRRAERLRFSRPPGRESVARHDSLISLCEEGDAAAAAEVAFDTWHSLTPEPTADPED